MQFRIWYPFEWDINFELILPESYLGNITAYSSSHIHAHDYSDNHCHWLC